MEEKDFSTFFKETSEMLQQYVSKRITLLRLEAIDITTRIFSSLIVYLIITLVLFLVLMMLSVLGGLFFSRLFDSFLAGFGLMSGIYILLFIVLIMSRKYLIEKFFAEQFLKIIIKDHDDDED